MKGKLKKKQELDTDVYMYLETGCSYSFWWYYRTEWIMFEVIKIQRNRRFEMWLKIEDENDERDGACIYRYWEKDMYAICDVLRVGNGWG